jgi:hypothetical protein
MFSELAEKFRKMRRSMSLKEEQKQREAARKISTAPRPARGLQP